MSTKNDLPSLTVIIPCRNEEHFIEQCLDSILRNDYPVHAYEVLVVDGMSTDRTRSLVRKYILRHGNVKLLDNPKKITPTGLNIGIRAAAGEVICRIDAHARISQGYLRRCAEHLCSGVADNVGGSMRTIPSRPNLVARSIALCMSHKFGVGNSAFRTGCNKPTFTDTVFGGCYRKRTLEWIGLYNENLPRTQDFELNQRLRKSGGRILLDPAIQCDYFASPNLPSFFRHNFRDGLWSLLPFLHSNVFPVRARHLIPLAFIAASIALSVGALWFRPLRSLLTIGLVGYVTANLAASVHVCWKERNYLLPFTMPIVFFLRHCAYGFGSLVAVLSLPGKFAFVRRASAQQV